MVTLEYKTDAELYRCAHVKTVSILPSKRLKIICETGERCIGCWRYDSESGTDISELQEMIND